MLGTVHLTLTLADRELDVHASPLQASLLELFSQQGVSIPARPPLNRLDVRRAQTRGRRRRWPIRSS
jgi:hypothetical protein